jgi:hypothetical protein
LSLCRARKCAAAERGPSSTRRTLRFWACARKKKNQTQKHTLTVHQIKTTRKELMFLFAGLVLLNAQSFTSLTITLSSVEPL